MENANICSFDLCLDIFESKHKVYWEHGNIKYSGVPFVILSTLVMDCHHGKDRKISMKKKYKEKRDALVVSVFDNSLQAALHNEKYNNIF